MIMSSTQVLQEQNQHLLKENQHLRQEVEQLKHQKSRYLQIPKEEAR